MDEKKLKAVTAQDLVDYVNGLLESGHREAVSVFLEASVPAASDCQTCEVGEVVHHRTPLCFLSEFFGCNFVVHVGEDRAVTRVGVL